MPWSQDRKFQSALDVYGKKIRTYARKSVYMVPGFGAEDIEQELKLVLLKCIESYDPNRGAKFSTTFWNYAHNRVRDLNRVATAQKRTAEFVSLSDESVAHYVDEWINEHSAEDWVIALADLRIISEYGADQYQAQAS